MKMRWKWLAAATVIGVVPMLQGVPAMADECPPLDVDCVAGDAVEEAEGQAEETAGTATDTVDPVVEGTLDQVNELLGGGGEPPPGGGGGPAGGGVGGGSGGGNGGGGSHGRGAGTTLVPGTALPGTVGSPIALSTGLAPVPVNLGERLTQVAAGAVESLAVVLVLLGVAVGFVLIQDRLDKKDPRLALAPIRSDLVHFA
jgi:hypothetical protein